MTAHLDDTPAAEGTQLHPGSVRAGPRAPSGEDALAKPLGNACNKIIKWQQLQGARVRRCLPCYKPAQAPTQATSRRAALRARAAARPPLRHPLGHGGGGVAWVGHACPTSPPWSQPATLYTQAALRRLHRCQLCQQQGSMLAGPRPCVKQALDAAGGQTRRSQPPPAPRHCTAPTAATSRGNKHGQLQGAGRPAARRSRYILHYMLSRDATRWYVQIATSPHDGPPPQARPPTMRARCATVWLPQSQLVNVQ
jgi:hypothetical protein